MTVRGDLRETGLATVMRHLYAERKSGILHVSRQRIKKRIYFKKGAAVFADGGGDGQTRQQAETLLYSLFTWTSGEYYLEEIDTTIDDALAFTTSPSEIILEGGRSVEDREILEKLLGGRESVFACAQTTQLPLFKIKLSPAERAVLKFSREHDRFTIADFPRVSSEIALLRALIALTSVGLLEIVKRGTPVETSPPPQPAPPQPAPRPSTPPQTAPPRPEPVPSQPVSSAPPPSASSVEPLPVGNDVEQLLDTFEAKRHGVAPPTSPTASIPTPEPATPPAPAAPEPPPPEPVAPPVAASSEGPPDDTEPLEPTRVDVPEMPPEPPKPPEPPRDATPPAGAPRSSRLSGQETMAKLSRLIPDGKGRIVAAAAVACFVAALLLGLWLTSGDEESVGSETVAASGAGESAETPVTGPPATIRPEPPRPMPVPQEPPQPDPEPPPKLSEAELFYRANLAFENGDYEQSKRELEALLARKPDLGAAQALMTRVERALEPEPPKPAPKPRRRRVVKKPEPQPPPEPEAQPIAPPTPTPADVFAEARSALARNDFPRAESNLETLREMDPTYPGARELERELEDAKWRRSLPLVYSARHDHSFGSCNGVLTLTTRGIGFRSDDHTWQWSFADLSRMARRSPTQLRIETRRGKKYKLDLREPIEDEDWTRFLSLAR